jgi:hypothetical protein
MKMTDSPGELGWGDLQECALPTAERPLRLAEFDDLFTTLRSIDRTSDTSTRLLLVGDEGLADRARQLADAESACCSFFTLTVAPVGDGLVSFEVEVPPAHAKVLGGLVNRAQEALGGAA